MSRLSRRAAGRDRYRTPGSLAALAVISSHSYSLRPNFPPRFSPARRREMPSAKSLTELENGCWMIGPVQPDDAGLSVTAIMYTQ